MLKKIFFNAILAVSLSQTLPLSAASNCPCPNCECTDCDCANGNHCDHCEE